MPFRSPWFRGEVGLSLVLQCTTERVAIAAPQALLLTHIVVDN